MVTGNNVMKPGPHLNIKTLFPGMEIPMLKIRRSQDRLIFNMGIPILVRRHFYIEKAPWIDTSSCRFFLNPKKKYRFITQGMRQKLLWWHKQA